MGRASFGPAGPAGDGAAETTRGLDRSPACLQTRRPGEQDVDCRALDATRRGRRAYRRAV